MKLLLPAAILSSLALGLGLGFGLKKRNKSTPPLQFSTKSWHGCAVYSSQVQCVGRNDYGQVSDSRSEAVTTPVPFVFPEENSALPTKAVAGGYHTCVLMNDGSVWCKGYNYFGQLGDGTTTDSATPVQVKKDGIVITNAIDIEAGYAQTCIKLSDDSLYCFGLNEYSQLGFNEETNLDVKLMALNEFATCIVKNSQLNEVFCKGNTSMYHDKPYSMGDGEEIVKLVSGINHFCVLLESKKAKCFGDNFAGQLGNGSDGFDSDSFDSAVDVVDSQDGSPLSGITDINTGGYSTCLVVSNNTPMCFGDNGYYNLGIANGGADVLVPTDRGDIASIHVGEYTGHVVYQDNSVFSWGWNRFGGRGDGSVASSSDADVIGDTAGEAAVKMNFNWN